MKNLILLTLTLLCAQSAVAQETGYLKVPIRIPAPMAREGVKGGQCDDADKDAQGKCSENNFRFRGDQNKSCILISTGGEYTEKYICTNDYLEAAAYISYDSRSDGQVSQHIVRKRSKQKFKGKAALFEFTVMLKGKPITISKSIEVIEVIPNLEQNHAARFCLARPTAKSACIGDKLLISAESIREHLLRPESFPEQSREAVVEAEVLDIKLGYVGIPKHENVENVDEKYGIAMVPFGAITHINDLKSKYADNALMSARQE